LIKSSDLDLVQSPRCPQPTYRGKRATMTSGECIPRTAPGVACRNDQASDHREKGGRRCSINRAVDLDRIGAPDFQTTVELGPDLPERPVVADIPVPVQTGME